MSSINRITVFGAPGAGKTYLTKKLQDIFNLPVCHLDSIHLLPNWEIRDKSERDKIILEKTATEKWILDGTYLDTLDERIKRADLNIFLDFKTKDLLKGVIERTLKNNGKEREDIPGCIEKFDLNFLVFVAKYNHERRSKIYQIVEKNRDKNIVILNSRDSVDKYISLLKMEENNY